MPRRIQPAARPSGSIRSRPRRSAATATMGATATSRIVANQTRPIGRPVVAPTARATTPTAAAMATESAKRTTIQKARPKMEDATRSVRRAREASVGSSPL